MPRYYSDKIFNHQVEKYAIKTVFNYRSEAKSMVKSALSRALADRAFLLRCLRDSDALAANEGNGVSAYLATRLSESSTLLSRDFKAKQSLQAFYQRSRF